MQINDYNCKIVICHYPRFAGGKVLLNCLGLSKDFALQNYHAPILPKDKFIFLKKGIDDYDSTTKWKDLGLGCKQLFGDDYEKWLDGIFENLNAQAKDVFSRNRYLPIVSNDETMLKNFKTLFPSNVVISFYNFEKFVLSRKGDETIIDGYNKINKIRNKMPQLKLPKHCPRSLQEFLNFQNEIEYHYPQFYKKLSTLTSPSFYSGQIKWNVEWFDDVDKTLNEIEKIYKILGLKDFNKEYVKYFFSQWKIKVYDTAMIN